jgi:non-heme chloroperoxidase
LPLAFERAQPLLSDTIGVQSGRRERGLARLPAEELPMPFFTASSTPAVNLHYQDVGQGPAVVLIHCWPLSHRAWERQVDALIEGGFRCVAYDRRGFGQSDQAAGGYDYDTLAADLHDLLVALDLWDVALVGYSMGGGEVARYLARYGAERVSRAVLIATALPCLIKAEDNPEGIEPQAVLDLAALLKQDRLGYLDGFMHYFFGLEANPTAASDDLVRYAKTIAWFASPLAMRECFMAAVATDFRADIPSIRVPTLLVHGDADVNVPLDLTSRRAAALIPGSRLALIPGAPHGLTFTHSDQLNALLLDFLRSSVPPHR